MGTVVFDFDSTIISVESLELILEEQAPEVKREIEAITEDGLRGKIPFSESLARRLALAAPSRDEVLRFGDRAKEWLTSGMDSLIQELQKNEVDVWIVSGGIKESILPLASQLNIPESQVQAVTLHWNDDGTFGGIDEDNPFCRSKVEGVSPLVDRWSSPKIAVGDAMSDYRLFENGLVDRFILFTKHFRCDELLNKGVPEAREVAELREILLPWVIRNGKHENSPT